MEFIPRYLKINDTIRVGEKQEAAGTFVLALKKMINLDREMYLCQFPDGASTWLFPHELDFDAEFFGFLGV